MGRNACPEPEADHRDTEAVGRAHRPMLARPGSDRLTVKSYDVSTERDVQPSRAEPVFLLRSHGAAHSGARQEGRTR